MITRGQLEILRDALNECDDEMLMDKISIHLEPVSRNVTVEWIDFDDQDFQELSSANESR